MRIRKRQVPLPFSSISPVTLPSDPNFNRSPVVQLPLQQQQQQHPPLPTPGFDPCPSSDHPNHPIRQLPTQGRDSSALPAGTAAHGQDTKQKKKDDYSVLNQGVEEEERGGEGEKSNDTRKKGVLGAELGTGSRPQSSSYPQAVGRWGDGEKAFPLKKRRGSFDKRGNTYDYDDVDDDTIIMEKDSSNKKMQMMNNKMKTKMNKKFVQQQQQQQPPQKNDNHEQDQENKERKDGTVTGSVDSNNSNNNPSGAKKRGRGGALMEGSRCSRVNGRGWRCCQQTLVGYSLCEHHLGKGRLRSMTSVRSRSLATKKEEQQQPKNDDQDHHQQPLSNSSPSQQAKQITKRESLGENGENGKEEEEEDQKPLMMTKKRVKLGMVKARSISSLLGQNDNAIALADDNN